MLPNRLISDLHLGKVWFLSQVMDFSGRSLWNLNVYYLIYVVIYIITATELRPASGPVVGNDGELCWTALSSRSSRSRSDRLVPRAEVMAGEDESDDFCLFGKLDRGETDRLSGARPGRRWCVGGHTCKRGLLQRGTAERRLCPRTGSSSGRSLKTAGERLGSDRPLLAVFVCLWVSATCWEERWDCGGSAREPFRASAEGGGGTGGGAHTSWKDCPPVGKE